MAYMRFHESPHNVTISRRLSRRLSFYCVFLPAFIAIGREKGYIICMPELPEVETVRRGLEPSMVGRRITHIEIRRRDLRSLVPENFADGIVGHKVNRFERRGKYILAFMDNDEGFCLHLGMSGRVKIEPLSEASIPATHDHVIFTMGNRVQIVFNDPRRFGSLARIGKNWRQEKSFSSMGPEPLSEEFTGASMRKKFANKNAPVKTVLLDQSVVAGIGNIYACEALFHAGIDPAKKAGEISAPKIEKLVQAIRSVLLRAIEAGGSTLRDHRRTDGSEGYFQHDFSVYDREGKPCPDCRCDIATTGGIHRIAQAGRSTFYCPGKQK